MQARAPYAAAPLLLAALAPKCPLCVAAYVSAIGLGGLAFAAPVIVRGSQVAVVVLVVAVAARLGQVAWRIRRARCARCSQPDEHAPR